MRFAVLAFILAITCSVKSDLCYDSESHVIITNKHNQTGHWLLDMEVVETAAKPTANMPFTVAIQPKLSNCGSTRTASFKVSFLRSPQPPSGKGYELVPGWGYYKLNTTAVNWRIAEGSCEQENAHLLVLNSDKEANVIRNMLTHVTAFPYIFIGFNDIEEEGVYMTVFGTTLSKEGYEKWQPGEPNDRNKNQDCGGIDITGKLDDLDCSSARPFICEKEL